jgi:hypothetical protein
MDERRIDGLSRLVARSITTRRGFAALVAGFVGLAIPKLVASQQTCQPENAWCTLWLRCCDGFVCTMQLANPNLGVCLPGEDVNGAGFVFAGITPAASTSSSSANSSSDSPRKRSQATATRTATTTANSTVTPTPTPASGGGGNGNGNGGGNNDKNNNRRGARQRRDDKRETKQDRRESRREDELTPTSTPTATPAPQDRVPVAMTLDCGKKLDDAEFVRIRNTGDVPFRLDDVRADGTIRSGLSGLDRHLLRPNDDPFIHRATWKTANGDGLLGDRNHGVTLSVEVGGAALRCFRVNCDNRGTKSITCREHLREN